jgi:2-oxoisovalerate dehydrogenase E1 component
MLMADDTDLLLDLYRANAVAWWIDVLEKRYAAAGEAGFHLSGIGHAASSAVAPCLRPQDWVFCHYRAKALMVARGARPVSFFHGFFAKHASPSGGRLVSVHFRDPALRLFTMTGPVGNGALHAVGVASAVKPEPGNPVVVFGTGDGATQQGEVLEAIGEAVRSNLPVLFLVEDNGYAISTRTAGRTFFSLPGGVDAGEFLGVPIDHCDGRRILSCLQVFDEAASRVRSSRAPAIVVMRTERLESHSNADDQRLYRPMEELERVAGEGEPLRLFREDLVARGISIDRLLRIDKEAEALVTQAAHEALGASGPEPCRSLWLPGDPGFQPAVEHAGNAPLPRRSMLDAIRDVLRFRLETNPDVILFGEDIEDPKGDVFGVTRGLSTDFPDRVENAPLSESTILGVCIGRAMAGKQPVAMLQFADFIPLVFNQLSQELAPYLWRTKGTLAAPVILMAPAGAYRAGLGPYHAQTFDSTLAHIPGLVVAVPSNAEDAAGMLQSAFETRHPVAFLYPKSLLNDPKAASHCEPSTARVPFGKARVLSAGGDLTIVSWGSTMPLCVEAARVLKEAGCGIDLLDLRTLAPWDREAVLASCSRTKRLLVVHEDNLSVGFGAEVLATVAEHAGPDVRMRRVARPDTFLPYNFACQAALLPSVESIVEAAAGMVGLELAELAQTDEDRGPLGVFVLRAFRAGPADSVFRLLELKVAPGDAVAEGDAIGEYETEKSAAELVCPVAGTVEAVFACRGEELEIGAPLLSIRLADPMSRVAAPHPLEPGESHLAVVGLVRPSSSHDAPAVHVVCSHVGVARGSRSVPNADLLCHHDGKTSDDIVRTTGIESRCRAGDGEDAVELAVRAASALFDRCGRELAKDIGLVILSTSSVGEVSPSAACHVAGRLAACGIPLESPAAVDILAACSGFLYGLRMAHDFIQSSPGKLVLLVTAEYLSPLLDEHDFSTHILFGDAATAVLVGAGGSLPAAPFSVAPPIVRAKPDTRRVLTAQPIGTGGHIEMDGQRVFREAVRSMTSVTRDCCREAGVPLDEVAFVVPHQANQRILDAVGAALGVSPERVATNIATTGNTSSSSIPLLLHDLELENRFRAGDNVCLCSFGAGFTYGAAMLRRLPTSAS